MAEVTFLYTVTVEDDAIEFNEDEGRWVLKEEAREDAYDMLMDGISDRSDNWYPRHNVLCLESFMAGAICDRPKDHYGGHSTG